MVGSPPPSAAPCGTARGRGSGPALGAVRGGGRVGSVGASGPLHVLRAGGDRRIPVVALGDEGPAASDHVVGPVDGRAPAALSPEVGPAR